MVKQHQTNKSVWAVPSTSPWRLMAERWPRAGSIFFLGVRADVVSRAEGFECRSMQVGLGPWFLCFNVYLKRVPFEVRLRNIGAEIDWERQGRYTPCYVCGKPLPDADLTFVALRPSAFGFFGAPGLAMLHCGECYAASGGGVYAVPAIQPP